MEEQENPRVKFINKLEDDIKKASLSRQFIDSESGQFVISYISETISTYTNMLINSRKTHEEYIEIRAKIDVLRKLKQVLEVQSTDSAIKKLRADLDLAQSE